MHRVSGQTQLAEKMQNLSKNDSDIAAYITKLLLMPEDTVIQLINL